MKGTKVQNPMKRKGEWGFAVCVYCGHIYTRLGLGHHQFYCESKRLIDSKPITLKKAALKKKR